MLIEIAPSLRELSENNNLNIVDNVARLEKSKKILDTYSNIDNIQKLTNGEVPKELLKIWNILLKIQNNRNKLHLGQSLYYEEARLPIYYSNNYSFININYNGKNVYISENNKKINITDFKGKEQELLNKFKTYKTLNQQTINEIKSNKSYQKLNNEGQLYPVFLNIKNPLQHDYEGSELGTNYKQNDKYPLEYVMARQVKKALQEGNDGVIYSNVYDPTLADNYGAFNSNQIKSATNNNGEFSTTNDDIRYSIRNNENNLVNSEKNSNFANLNKITKEQLRNNNINEEVFNNMTQDMKDYVIKCATI
jgi:hypothetical protein